MILIILYLLYIPTYMKINSSSKTFTFIRKIQTLLIKLSLVNNTYFSHKFIFILLCYVVTIYVKNQTENFFSVYSTSYIFINRSNNFFLITSMTIMYLVIIALYHYLIIALNFIQTC